jgi:tetraprenyl-beta-curcumene synthase
VRSLQIGITLHPELRKQALASMDTKQFHCEGGGVYVTANLARRHELIALIVAFQTISDYLDNLCDRSTSMDPDDFRSLHQSMLDAVNPNANEGRYYEHHPEQEDGGYLQNLVRECQRCIARLPSYSKVQSHIIELVGLYCDLQVYKHIRKDEREHALLAWWEKHKEQYPQLLWNEFAAATGSTLGVFMLFVAASYAELTEVEASAIRKTYFPYICGLHILLDYLIDQQEDVDGGDLNFCRYYESPEHAAQRIGWIASEAKQAARALHTPGFHKMIIEGLQALYLSDPKAGMQSGVRITRGLLMKRSPISRVFFWVNSMWVRKTQ